MRSFSVPFPSRRALSASLLLTVIVAGCQCGTPAVDELGDPLESLPEGAVALQFGDDVDPSTQQRVELLVRQVSAPRAVTVLPADAAPSDGQAALVLSFGRTASTEALIGNLDRELEKLGSEGFLVRSGSLGGAKAFAAVGNAMEGDTRPARIGTGFASYALLEELGFGFLHPLEPTLPSTLRIPRQRLALAEKPHWKVRGLQLHTMHPLELTDVLNGWGKTGPEDEQGFREMLPEWDRFLEWMLANRQNRVHWILLHAASWAEFSDGPVRLARLTELVDMAHTRGILVGVDVPVALEQQHAYRLLRTGDATLEEEVAEIKSRIDWLMGAGFDYLATEAGYSEFTHPSSERMLAWMNTLAIHLDEAHGGKQAIIKIHCSQDQFAEPYRDPRDNGPLNFNFLPTHADPRLAVMPHTVQHYSLDDPAPTYSNADFGFIREYLQYETGKRPVIWHPETAYWVSFDIDVPLFLPVYAERRVHDLHLLGGDERAGRMGGPTGKEQMDGQIIFSSGWEWGYWLNDVVTARAAWNPHLDTDVPTALRRLLKPLSRTMGTRGEEVIDVLVRMAARQRELLIEGRVQGVVPDNIHMRNGQAYLQGWDTWDDVGNLGRSLGVGPQMQTQPDKLGLVNMRNPLHGGPRYTTELSPLLGEMRFALRTYADELGTLREAVPASAHGLFDEFSDAAEITALRAEQVHGLYDYVDGFYDQDKTHRTKRLAIARAALDDALEIVKRREQHYRVEADRIAGWRNNPTAYEYGYLWTVRSLHYWWRDEGKAVEAPISPCYLNIINPVDVAMGEGTMHDLVTGVRHLFEEDSALGVLTECLAETRAEPVYPNARIGR